MALGVLFRLLLWAKTLQKSKQPKIIGEIFFFILIIICFPIPGDN